MHVCRRCGITSDREIKTLGDRILQGPLIHNKNMGNAKRSIDAQPTCANDLDH